MSIQHSRSQQLKRDTKSRRGSIVVLTAALMIPLLAMVAFSVDLGFIAMSKSQLQNSADSAALAAVATLSNTDLGEGSRETNARLWATSFAEKNLPDLDKIVVDADITLGTWNPGSRTFTPTLPNRNPNAARVVTRRTSDSGGQVPTFFGSVLGYNGVDVTASAIAKAGEDDPRDVILVLDCSGSMASHSRMTYTKSAAYALVEELLDTDRLGLVVYSYVDDGKTTGHLEQAMDFNHSPVLTRIPQLEAGMYTNMTNIAGGMRVALEEFAANDRGPSKSASKVMVLMTDGQANITEPPGISPNDSIEYYAQMALNEGVVIHSVTLGSGADKVTVSEAAKLTGGSTHHIEDGDHQELIEAFRKIGRGDGIARIVQ